MRTIETVIQRLGYHNSEKLFYLSEIGKCTDLSWHDRRVLRELAPYATYVVDGSVLTVFFDDLNNRYPDTSQERRYPGVFYLWVISTYYI